MGLRNDVFDAFRFKDTIFYKESSELEDKYEALKKLDEEYPNNKNLKNEMFIVRKGLEGENEIAYQLKKANIGMYVLRDIKFKYQDLTAQIDYVIITPAYTYYVECKNLLGNITVNENGDFIREIFFNGKKIKRGMYSPLRQVEAQREVIRKIWESKASALNKLFASKYFEYYRRVLVVVANPETILNTNKAPNEIKYKILRADSLIRKLEDDIACKRKDEYLNSESSMKETAQVYLKLSFEENINYYEYYKNKYCQNYQVLSKEEDFKAHCEDLKSRLIKLRKERANQMQIPAYYVFNNDELYKLIEIKPKTIQELMNANILPAIKIKTHGEIIVNEINK